MEKICGPCSLCCKLLDVEALEKPAGAWCPHVALGKGCSIYDTRPVPCRTFRCSWLNDTRSTEAWRPDRCGFLMRERPGNVLLVEVEPSKRDSWRREPFYSQIKRWSASVRTGQGAVMVKCAGRMTVIFPEIDLEIGAEPTADEGVKVGYETQGGKRRPCVEVIGPDGPVRRVLG